jgi:hypothetical protein
LTSSDRYPLDLVERDLIASAIIKLATGCRFRLAGLARLTDQAKPQELPGNDFAPTFPPLRIRQPECRRKLRGSEAAVDLWC